MAGRRLLPGLLVLAGLVAGGAAGYLARPAAPPQDGAAAGIAEGGPPAAGPGRDFVRLNNQFVVPVVEGGQVRALVILSLAIEAAAGASDRVFAQEPKLRDAFLRVLFDHANAGGFRGAFTAGGTLGALRAALREAAVGVLGPLAIDVLITDIGRQDA